MSNQPQNPDPYGHEHGPRDPYAPYAPHEGYDPQGGQQPGTWPGYEGYEGYDGQQAYQHPQQPQQPQAPYGQQQQPGYGEAYPDPYAAGYQEPYGHQGHQQQYGEPYGQPYAEQQHQPYPNQAYAGQQYGEPYGQPGAGEQQYGTQQYGQQPWDAPAQQQAAPAHPAASGFGPQTGAYGAQGHPEHAAPASPADGRHAPGPDVAAQPADGRPGARPQRTAAAATATLAEPTPAAATAAAPQTPSVPAPARPLTAAQRARAEGRSPIIDPGMTPALLTAAIAGLLAATAPLPRPATAAVVALLQAVTAAGWFRLNGMWPARQGIMLAFAGGLAADVGLLATDREDAPTVVIGTLGVWLLLVLILQLRNRSTPDERMYSLTATTVSTAVTVIAAGHLAAVAESSDAVVLGAAAIAAAALARALPLPTAVSVVAALLAAAGAGLAAGHLTDTAATGAAGLGAAAGVCALIGLRVAAYDYPSRFVHMTAGVALPLAAAAPAVYLIGRAIA
ncbi:hypothetical protein ACQUSR_18210 [Streptomyces sp. P1-3]|uniref:hypothetical protein n=1 Tax=Streptomyces sp. P1-3 TaxID=3421658 RepID=UPI003D35C3C3